MKPIVRRALYLLNVIQFVFVNRHMQKLIQQLPSETKIPDVRFGFTFNDISDLFHLWGKSGRDKYRSVAHFDIVGYMPSYGLLLGMLLHFIYGSMLQFTDGSMLQFIHESLSSVSFWVGLLLWCDLTETCILMLTCSAYPFDHVKNGQDLENMKSLIRIASIANMAKWVLATGYIVVSACFLILQQKYRWTKRVISEKKTN